MKTQISKPAYSKASYSKEYKQQALKLWRSSGRSAAKVAAELGAGNRAEKWGHVMTRDR